MVHPPHPPFTILCIRGEKEPHLFALAGSRAREAREAREARAATAFTGGKLGTFFCGFFLACPTSALPIKFFFKTQRQHCTPYPLKILSPSPLLPLRFSHHPLTDSDHTMEIWFECTTSGQRCAAEVGESCSVADLQERAVAVLYPQGVLSAEAVGLCVDGADGEVLAPEVLIADTALCAGGTVYVRKQDVQQQDADSSGGVWVPKCYTDTVTGSIGDVCEDTLVIGGERAVAINLVTTEVTPLPAIGGDLCNILLMPRHIVYCSDLSDVHFRPRDSGAEVVVRVARIKVVRLVAMRVTETVLIGTSRQIVQYSCEGVKMRTIAYRGRSFAVSPCETLFLTNIYYGYASPHSNRSQPYIGVYRLDTPELREVHRVDTGCPSFMLQPSFSPDASLAVLSCGGNHTVRTIDITSGKALCRLPKRVRRASSACFSACSQYLFTASMGSVQQWDARSGAPMGCIPVNFPSSVHTSTDGRKLVVVGYTISVLDIAAINALAQGPRKKRTVVATESRCSGCVCS